jgi:hypothetical protein
MVQQLGEDGWARFDGETHWVRCFAHILNLISQVRFAYFLITLCA